MGDARFLTEALGGRWYSQYGLTFCPAHANTRTPALSLAESSDGRLLAHCKAGCSFSDVIDAMRWRGLLEGLSSYGPPDPSERARHQMRALADINKRARQAESLWREALPIAGTVADSYIRGARGITCELPDTLRFHPACWHGATATRHPAILAQVEGSDGFAVHRTYLRADGGGKAALVPDKAMLGAVAGGAVRLSESQVGLAVAEGIETALSLSSGLLRAPAAVWAALSTSGLRGLRLPPQPGRLTIATDSDDNGAGMAAGIALAERAHALGWAVSMLPAPNGRDWNDILLMKGDAA